MTRTTRSAALLATLAAGLLLAGCASAGTASSESAGVVPAPAAEGAVDAGSGSGATARDGAVNPLAITTDRSVVVRADLTVRVDDLAASVDRLGGVIAKHDATIASQTSSSGGGGAPTPVDEKGAVSCPATGCATGYASSVTTLRVDNAEADALIADLKALGTVEAAYRTSDDVTAEVADVDARLATARASLVRVRALMDKAVTIADVVTLEAELSRRQADLEALEARQRTLADQTAQATVTVRLVDQGAPAVVEDSTGLVAGLRAGWSAFVAALVGALTVVGALLPFLLVLVPLALLVWWLVRRTSRRRTVPAPPAAPSVPLEKVGA